MVIGLHVRNLHCSLYSILCVNWSLNWSLCVHY